MYRLRQVGCSEAELISELAISSKATWGYDEDFMAACEAELSHTPAEIAADHAIYFLAEDASEVAGFYKLGNLKQKTVLLEALFVAPSTIGHGVGRILLEHAKDTAASHGARYLEAQSDPYAEPFYLAMGARVSGRVESGSIAGRFLSMVTMELG